MTSIQAFILALPYLLGSCLLTLVIMVPIWTRIYKYSSSAKATEEAHIIVINHRIKEALDELYRVKSGQ